MGNAALVIDNLATGGSVTATSQALTMPVSNLLTPHPSDRWRALTNSASIILDKGALLSSDTVGLFGLTCTSQAIIRLRLSSIDSTGAAGDVLDTGNLNGAPSFDASYGSFIYRMPSPGSSRYTRIDLTDPGFPSYVEAGSILDGLSQVFDYNFIPGATIQHTDRSRISKVASGKTLVWLDNNFRSVALSFDFVDQAQRYGVIERLDRMKGKNTNVLLMTDIASTDMPRDSVFGLVTDQTPITWGPAPNIFGKQLKIEERI